MFIHIKLKSVLKIINNVQKLEYSYKKIRNRDFGALFLIFSGIDKYI